MALELVSHGGEEPGAERVVLAGPEPRLQRQGDHRDGHAQVHGLLHRPPALTGVLDKGLKAGQVCLFVKGCRRKVEKPGADNATMPPQLGNLRQVEPELALGLHQLEALGVRLHQAVLDAAVDQLIEALREIAGGGAVLPPDIASKVIRSYSSPAGDILDRQGWDLSVREIEVLEMLYEGLRNAEIGNRLSISPRTVEAHVGNIISKLGTRSRTEAVRVAVEKNLIK